MIFSENRYPLFGIVLYERVTRHRRRLERDQLFTERLQGTVATTGWGP